MAEVGKLQVQQIPPNTFLITLSGAWTLDSSLPTAEELKEKIAGSSTIGALCFSSNDITDWDSGLLTFLLKVRSLCAAANITIDESGLPEGTKRLLALATAVPEKKDARQQPKRVGFLEHIGEETLDFFQGTADLFAFIGEMVLSLLRLLRGTAQFRRQDLWLIIEDCGGRALPIVSLICFLVGLILAFIGAIQLRLFGAEIYVADLVGIAMVRLMAAIMTGIVMAGRTGGAFAAQLGTMQVNQEIDALKTLGISPIDFLVLPRMLALALMMPLLCLYANLMGILGGLVVGVGMLDISLIQYYQETIRSVGLWNLAIGIFSGTVFGAIVALSGCMRGMQCGRSAAAVGDAATSAVVTAIVGIIVSTAIITIICQIIGI